MGRRLIPFLVAAAVVAGVMLPVSAAYGAAGVAAKTPDPCTLITDAIAASAPTPDTIEETSPNKLLKGNCSYSLTSDTKTGEPLILFVESTKLYDINKAITHKIKATKGLGVAGFTGVDGAGGSVLDFKTKTASVRLTGDFDTATMLAFAKGINKQLK